MLSKVAVRLQPTEPYAARLSVASATIENIEEEVFQASLRDARHFDSLIGGLKPHGYLQKTATRCSKICIQFLFAVFRFDR